VTLISIISVSAALKVWLADGFYKFEFHSDLIFKLQAIWCLSWWSWVALSIRNGI